MNRRQFLAAATATVITPTVARQIRRAVEAPVGGRARAGKAMVLAVMASDSNPNRTYEVRRGRDGNVYCTCPAWRFQHKAPEDRTCKHIDRLAAQMRRTA